MIRVAVRAVACAFLLSFTACNAGNAPARGFGSRQLLATRDPTFEVVGLDDDRLVTSSVIDGGNLYSSIDLTTGQVEDLGRSPVFFADDAGVARLTCATASSASGDTVLTITDSQTGLSTNIDGIRSWTPSCPTDPEQPMVVERMDSAGAITVWAGAYDRLAQIATDLVIRVVVTLDSTTTTVLAARVDAPAALGIFALDGPAFTEREIVAPALGAAAWADGATPGPALASASLDDGLPIWILADHFLYSRVMADGEIFAFVGPFAGGPELALFPVQPPLSFVYGRSDLMFTEGPMVVESNATGSVLRYWDDAGKRLVSCDLPPSTVPLSWTATPDGRRFLVGLDQEQDEAYGAAAPLLLVSRDLAAQGNACALLAKGDVTSSGFSPSGASMFWVTAPAVGDAMLWTAADGTAARKLGAGISIDHVHFLDDARLELALAQDLLWLDATEDAPSLHYIAEQVFGVGLDFGGSIITGYDFNQQDGTGQLGVVDRSTGLKKPISPSVVSYDGFAIATADGGAAQQVGVAYVVRGRNPSAQDGLWWATVDAADLQ